MPTPTFKLVILGFDPNGIFPLNVASTTTFGVGSIQPSNIHVLCRRCSGTGSYKVCTSEVPANRPGGTDYRAGCNPQPTDTAEMYVIDFDTQENAEDWMDNNAEILAGKRIYSVDDTASAYVDPFPAFIPA